MTRRGLGLIAGGIVVAFAMSTIPAMAQDQNSGGRRGNRGGPGGPGGFGGPGGPGGFGGPGGPGGFGGPGGPGGFGRGGFGMFGGGGSNLLDLAGRDPIQTELKVTDEQKTKIEKLAQESRARREKFQQEMRARMGRDNQAPNRGDQAPNRGRGNQGSIVPSPEPAATGVIRRASYQPQDGAGGYGGFGQGFGGGFGDNPYAPQQGVDPAMQQRMLQNQQRQMMQNQQREMQRMQAMQGFEQMRQASEKLRKEEETALGKILDAKQMKRLREIALQLEGPFAILSNQDLAKKLSVNQEQYAKIREIQQKSFQSGQNPFQGMRDLMQEFRDSQPQAENQDGNAQGRGRGGRGNFDREAFQKFMQRPEVVAKTEKMRDDQLAQRDAQFSAVLKALDRGQANKYRNMLGEKYDTTALARGFMGGMFGGPPPGAPAAPPADAAKPAPADEAKTDASNADAAKTDAPKEAPKAEEAKTDASAETPAPARGGSLRERRGLGGGARPQ